jgi:hypothetical protein
MINHIYSPKTYSSAFFKISFIAYYRNIGKAHIATGFVHMTETVDSVAQGEFMEHFVKLVR